MSAHQKPTVGDTKTSAQNADHMGWLRCEGRSLSKADFYFLWTVIGYSFGGSGDNFNLPDAQGRVAGFQGTGTDTNSLTSNLGFGSTIGEYKHTLTIPEIPTHNHVLTDPQHRHTGFTDQQVDRIESEAVAKTGVDRADVSGQDPNYLTFSTSLNATGITLASTGGGLSHNNVQPTIVLGNLFIYSGLPNYPYYPQYNFPFKSGTNIL